MENKLTLKDELTEFLLYNNAINTVKQKSLKLKILGSYPVAVL